MRTESLLASRQNTFQRFSLLTFGLVFALTCTSSVRAVDAPHLVFSELPEFRQLALSPDGTKAVGLRALQDTYHVIVLDFEKGTSKLIMAADPEKFLYNWCQFANNNRILCSIRSYQVRRVSRDLIGHRDGRTIATRLLAVDANGENRLQLVREKKTRAGGKVVWNPRDQDQIVSWLPNDPDHILLQLTREDPRFPSVYKLNINNNRMKKVQGFRKEVFFWGGDRQGTVRNGWGVSRGKKTNYVAKKKEGGFQQLDLSALEGEAPLSALGYTTKGDLVVVAYNGKNTQGLYLLNSETGAIKKTIYHDENFDTRNALFNPFDASVLAVVDPTTGRYRWLDKDLGAEYETLRVSLPGKPARVAIQSLDWKSNRLIMRSEGNSTHPAYYMYDRAKKSLVALGKDYAEVPSEELTEKQAVSYKARDGLTIPAYLSLPRNVAPRGLPTIILPHGGPWARDYAGFDYWVQYLNNRGYAVLQPNFRGSAGFGDDYMRKGFEQWGLAMQNDLDDGLAWMIEQGYTDPQRVCMVGGSYGGYAALVASYKSSDKYRCAVSFAGVTDLDGLVKLWRTFRNGRIAGARVQSGSSREENSPIKQVDKISLPLLLVHGDVDLNVRFEQATDFVAALDEADKAYRYIHQPNGDHFLSLQKHRAEFFTAMDEFLSEHLVPSTPAGELDEAPAARTGTSGGG